MNYFRLVVYALIVGFAYWQANEQLTSAFSNDDIIKVDGVLNVWASHAMLLIFLYLIIYVIKDEFKLPFRIGEVNRVLIVVGLVVSPALAMITYGQSKENVAHYVECKSERQFSSRYSSRTYALNEQLCQEISSK